MNWLAVVIFKNSADVDFGRLKFQVQTELNFSFSLTNQSSALKMKVKLFDDIALNWANIRLCNLLHSSTLPGNK